jgi:hypothetical protein
MKNFINTTGNRTCELPTCSAVPQRTAPPRVVQKFVSRVFVGEFVFLPIPLKDCLCVCVFEMVDDSAVYYFKK